MRTYYKYTFYKNPLNPYFEKMDVVPENATDEEIRAARSLMLTESAPLLTAPDSVLVRSVFKKLSGYYHVCASVDARGSLQVENDTSLSDSLIRNLENEFGPLTNIETITSRQRFNVDSVPGEVEV